MERLTGIRPHLAPIETETAVHDTLSCWPSPKKELPVPLFARLQFDFQFSIEFKASKQQLALGRSLRDFRSLFIVHFSKMFPSKFKRRTRQPQESSISSVSSSAKLKRIFGRQLHLIMCFEFFKND
jgi:hypothetical protein